MRPVLISIAVLQVALTGWAGHYQPRSMAGGVIHVGTLVGTLMDGSVGRNLNEADRLIMERTTQRTLEVARIGQVVQWRNPDTGNSGTVTVTSGQQCRQYYQTVTVSGRTDGAFASACRQPDGSWKIAG